MNYEGALLKDTDLVQWLENRLGDPSDLGSGQQASSLLNEQMIIELETCFQALDSKVKTKILQAMVHLSPTLIQKWRDPLNNLLDIARRDADDWVELVADMFRDFPDQNLVQCLPSNLNSIFYKTLNELSIKLKSAVESATALDVLPPDCERISISAIMARYGIPPELPKHHFKIKKKTKSQLLMEDVEKAAELHLANQNKKGAGGIVSSLPIKIRSTARNANNMPMRGIPSANTNKFSGGFTNEPKKFQRQLANRTGGAMLLDITDLPSEHGRRRRATLESKAKKQEGVTKKIRSDDKSISETDSVLVGVLCGNLPSEIDSTEQTADVASPLSAFTTTTANDALPTQPVSVGSSTPPSAGVVQSQATRTKCSASSSKSHHRK